MADFVAVLKKTIDGLGENTPAMREKVYQKARSTVAAKLAAISPPPPAAVAERQKRALDEAIAAVEGSYAGADEDPFAELENVFTDPVKKPEQGRGADAAGAGRLQRRPEALAGSRPRAALDSRGNEPSRGPACSSTARNEEEDGEPGYEPMERRRNFAPLIAAVVALVVLAGGGYAVWLNKEDFQAMLGIGGGQTTLANAPAAGDPTAPAAAKKAVNDANAPGEGVEKFTQRLNSDGSEVDEGPAGGIASLGEGTSVASVTPGSTPPVDSAAVADPAAPAVADPAAPAAVDPAAPVADPAAPVAAPQPRQPRPRQRRYRPRPPPLLRYRRRRPIPQHRQRPTRPRLPPPRQTVPPWSRQRRLSPHRRRPPSTALSRSPRRQSSTRNAPTLPRARQRSARSCGRWSSNRRATTCRRNRLSAPRPRSPARI